jgi:hypothetical protein
MKHSNDTIGNRDRDLPSCRAVSQPTAPPRSPLRERTAVPFDLEAWWVPQPFSMFWKKEKNRLILPEFETRTVKPGALPFKDELKTASFKDPVRTAL